MLSVRAAHDYTDLPVGIAVVVYCSSSFVLSVSFGYLQISLHSILGAIRNLLPLLYVIFFNSEMVGALLAASVSQPFERA